jgi:hypothetical protein
VPKKAASKRKQSKARDGGPKKGRTAYSFFQKAEYKRLKTTHAETSFAVKSRLVADRWKGLDSVAKERYAQLSDADKGRYAQEMKVYEKKREREGESGGVGVEKENDSEPGAAGGGLKKKRNVKKSSKESDSNWAQTCDTLSQANAEGPVPGQYARARREGGVKDYAAMFAYPDSDDDY